MAALLDQALRTQVMFEAGRDLHVIACRKSRGIYTVGVLNNTLRPLPLRIVSRCGPIQSIRELPLDISERGAPGHLPPGVDTAMIGANGPQTIAGHDVRIFEVRLEREVAEEIPHVVPPKRPRGRILPLRKICSLKEEILARPTFFDHFDGVLVDWRYLHDRRIESVREEAAWLGRQGLRVIVDLTSGVNSYPDLRLTNNLAADYAASMSAVDDVLAKMTALDARELVLSSYRQPESNLTEAQTAAAIETTIGEILSPGRPAARDRLSAHLSRQGPLEPRRCPADRQANWRCQPAAGAQHGTVGIGVSGSGHRRRTTQRRRPVDDRPAGVGSAGPPLERGTDRWPKRRNGGNWLNC